MSVYKIGIFDKSYYLKKRYSIYIKPIAVITNMMIINGVLLYFFYEKYFDSWNFIYVNISWLIISYYLNFFNLRRYNKNVDVVSRLFYQFLFFTFVYFAFFAFANQTIDIEKHINALGYIFLMIALFRTFYLYVLKKYRNKGGNFRNIIIIGADKSTKKISKFFHEHTELGYRILGYFTDETHKKKKRYLGTIESCFDYALNNEVDEIYCSISELSSKQIESFINFADNNLKVLKLIPESKDDFTTKMDVEYYDYIPILSLRTIALDFPLNRFIKKLFDVIFSLVIIIFVLSWLTLILFVLIKLESKGPVFFKQTRDGLSGNKFMCYKYRSMHLNDMADDIQVTKHDARVTKIGSIIRRTSIDELPQFFNVLLGDMSIVGPRPHMSSETKKYAKTVDKFMVRHFIKPGITGLAQIRGYRGEVEKNEDMENRVKLDIFYIENWSFLLDLKIVLQTVINIFRGEDKAY